MFFEDEKENLENSDSLDDLELDLDDEIDDESISWDELLKDDSVAELVSISSDSLPQANKEPVTIRTEAAPIETKTNDAKDIVDDELDIDMGLSDLSDEDFDEESSQNDDLKKDAFEVFGGETEDEDNHALADNIMDDDSQSILNELDGMEVSDDLAEAELQADKDDVYTPTMIQPENTAGNIAAIAGIAFAVILVVGSLIFIFAGSKNLPDTPKNPPVVQKEPTPAPPRESVKVPSEDAEQIPVVNDENAKKLKPEKKVVLSVESAGRTNPFMPTFDDFGGSLYSGIPAQVLLPPDSYGEEPDAQELMRVSVSGILFDNVKPSAIVTINDLDYFVQKGDLVDDYVVLDINRQAVVIKKGTNVYKAGVGERFNQSVQIDGRAVYRSNGARQYISATDDHTSASDVEVRSRSGNNLRPLGPGMNDRARR